jgi:hypothetical protein
MPRQKPTNPDTPDWALSPQQETAVDLLASGKTVTDTAEAIEVTRQTVSEWLNHHPGFEAALNSRRRELWNGMTDTLRGLLPTALEVLKCELESETPLPAAVHVLKACGLYGVPAPHGPTEVEDAVAAQRQRAYQRALANMSGL